MESSRTAFLLARFLGLSSWINAIYESTYVVDRLWTLASYKTAAGIRYSEGFLVFLVGRIVLSLVLGSLIWWNAARIAGWLEGKKEEEHSADVPPLSSP